MLNNQIFYFFYSFAHQSTLGDSLIIFFAEIFPYIILVLAFLFVLLHKDIQKVKNPFYLLKQKWREVLIVFFSGLLAWTVGYLLKNIFLELRPFLALPNVIPLWVESGYAFPSGHSTAFMALGLSIFLIHKKVGYLFIFSALIIGITRIMAGVHYPIDILGGWVLGILIAYIVNRIFTKNK